MYSKKELNNELLLLSQMSKTENDSCTEYFYCQSEKDGLWNRCSGFQKNKQRQSNYSRHK